MRYKHPAATTGYFHYCDNCEIDDGRDVLFWKNGFAICHECLKMLYIKHVAKIDKKEEYLSTKRKTITEKMRSFIFERDGYKCIECGSKDKIAVDHIIPFVAGGTTDEWNLQTLCRTCNSRKGCRIEKR